MGLAKHIRTAISSPHHIPELAALAIDDLRGLDFLRNVEPETVGLDPAVAFHYSPSSKTWLRSVLKQMSISENDKIVDIGCGKGAAMRIMLDFPFGRVDGVELSTEMALIAKRNFETLHVAEGRVGIHNIDACDFDGLDNFNYVYLFNPFPSPVFARFFARVVSSIVRRPRKLTIIYNNPACHDQIDSSGRFQKTLELIADWGNPLFVYKSL
jgi:SAM-dependent methyltransferase